MVKNNDLKKITLDVYVIEGCPYCGALLERLNSKNIIFNKTIVNPDEKEKYKKMHKHPTFPHVFINFNKKRIKIGGYEDFDKLMYLCKFFNNKDITLKDLKFICEHFI